VFTVNFVVVNIRLIHFFTQKGDAL